MRKNSLAVISAVAIVAASAVPTAFAQNQSAPGPTSRPAQAERSSEETLREIAREVYQYAYPIVLMDTTMRWLCTVSLAARHWGSAVT